MKFLIVISICILQIVKSHLYNVLLFPDGGWLVENRYLDDATRIHQMNALRKLCIPKVSFFVNKFCAAVANHPNFEINYLDFLAYKTFLLSLLTPSVKIKRVII